ncbi:MAG: hypothetical protein KC729_19620, partial [Candidatus Eisenbacteria bacterium]|nr:hypothetical protein [Candidatus Eisenbacteria bacterium]
MTTVTALLPTPTCPLCGSDDPKKVKKRPDGAFYCYRCKRSIGAVEGPQKRTDPITDAFIEAAHRKLCADAKAMAWLTDHRCIPLPVIKSQRLGLDGNKILFPIPGDGEWVNIRCANYVTGEKRPYQTGRGVQLYPGTLAPTKELLICEGELDRLVALGLGFEACTGIGGAGVFHSTWAAEIAQKAEHVVIVYDADHAGRSGARLVATRLMEQGVLATRIKSVHLPVPFKPKHGEDLTDWVRRGATAKDLRTLIGDTPTWEYVERAPGVVPADATERSLAEASHKDHSREWSTFEASIIALLADAYQLPTKISVDCAEDQSKYCPHCTLPAEKSRCAPGEAPIISLDTTSDAYVDHIGAAKKNLRQQILESIGIPGKCPSAQVDELETIQVQEGRIGEPLNIDVETRASDRSAIFIDLEGIVEPNKEYRMLGKFLPHPKDQVMTAVIHRAVGVDQLVEHFEEDPKLLAPMRKGRPRTLEKRVQRILDDATAITRIRGRDDMHLMILLSRMSTLYLESPESETRERGWADVAIIGDTSEGKSEAMEKLSAWTGLGNVVALKKATTRAGLFGGVVQTQKKLYIAWGVYPRHDRRWLAPDEFHSAPADLLAAMTDARS